MRFLPNKRGQFESTVTPYLDAAYNLARWLTGRDEDAQDVVQEALLRAFKFFDGFRGGDSRAWLLAIVRNTAYTWLRQNRAAQMLSWDDEMHTEALTDDAEEDVIQSLDHQALHQAIAALPIAFREVVILHDLEGLAYKEVAAVANIPIGTVMSRLARARKQLYLTLTHTQRIDRGQTERPERSETQHL
jgi:RNA polymerase sigma-70 factor (ECF subfamily)